MRVIGGIDGGLSGSWLHHALDPFCKQLVFFLLLFYVVMQPEDKLIGLPNLRLRASKPVS